MSFLDSLSSTLSLAHESMSDAVATIDVNDYRKSSQDEEYEDEIYLREKTITREISPGIYKDIRLIETSPNSGIYREVE